MAVIIILGLLVCMALESGSMEGVMVFGGILVVYILNKLGKSADKNSAVPKTPKPNRPHHTMAQNRDYNDLLAAITRFIDSNGRNFDYLYIGTSSYGGDSRLPGSASVCLPYDYVSNECIAVIYPNGRSVCYNYFQNGRYCLSEETIGYLAYQLAQRYGGQHFPRYDDGDLENCIIYSNSGLQKYRAFREQEKAYFDSIKRI